MNMNPEYLFKFIYILPLALIPIVVFVLSKKYLSSVLAFLACIFLMSQAAFFSQTAAYRNYVALLFFGLTIMVLFSKELNIVNRRLLFIIFSIAIIISHYATTYIFFFMLLFTFIGSNLIWKLNQHKRETSDHVPDINNWNSYFFQSKVDAGISFAQLFLFIILFFVWFGVATQAPFNSGVYFLSSTIKNLQNLFLNEMRSPEVSAAMGSSLRGSPVLSYINFVTAWLSVIFIAVGVLVFMFKPKFTSEWKMTLEPFILAFISAIILAVSIILPFILVGYSFGRLYYQCMIILSTYFIFGGIILTRLIHIKMRWSYVLMLVVLIPLFMNATGLLPQLFSKPSSIILNSATKLNDPYYIYDSEAYGANWIKNYVNVDNTNIYADDAEIYRLMSIANIYLGLNGPTNLTNSGLQINNGYIYLGYDNVVKHEYWSYSDTQETWESINSNELINKFNGKDLIYSNDGSQVWAGFDVP